MKLEFIDYSPSQHIQKITLLFVVKSLLLILLQSTSRNMAAGSVQLKWRHEQT